MTGTEKRDFDKVAQTYDQPHAVKRAQDVAEAIKRQVPLDLKMDVMDLGAGTGLVSLALWPFVHSIRAVDSSRGMLAVLKQKVSELGITNVKTRFCDLESDCLRDDVKWDLIISVMTFHHIADVPRLLRGLYGILKPGGILAIADLDTEDGGFHPDNAGIHHFGFDREKLKRLFEDAGFRGVEVSTAHKASKEVASGATREFSVFLMSGTHGLPGVERSDGCL